MKQIKKCLGVVIGIAAVAAVCGGCGVKSSQSRLAQDNTGVRQAVSSGPSGMEGIKTAESTEKSRKLLSGVVLEGNPVLPAQISEFAEKTGFPVHYVVFFLAWPAFPPIMAEDNFDDSLFPEKSFVNINAAGAVPCVTWEPMSISEIGEKAVEYKAVMEGIYDAYIRGFARRGAKLGFPIMMRFGHEMNLERYHWGGDRESYGPESPSRYKDMYRRLYNIFREEKADNFIWVFCPNAETVPNISWDETAGWNTIEAYYPGHEYVHIMGVDGYNWGKRSSEEFGWESRFRSFSEIFRSSVNQLRAIAPGKPILIFETASGTRGGDKLAWIAEAWKKTGEMGISGMAWFQAVKEEAWAMELISSPDGSDETVFNRLLQFHPDFALYAEAISNTTDARETFRSFLTSGARP